MTGAGLLGTRGVAEPGDGDVPVSAGTGSGWCDGLLTRNERLWSNMADSSLTAISSASARPAGDDPADRVGPRRRDVRGQTPGRAYRKSCPRQPPGPAPATPVREQYERCHDLDAVDRQRERMRVPPGLAMAGGQLANMGNVRKPRHCAALMTRDLVKRTGSGSPSTKITRFA